MSRISSTFAKPDVPMSSQKSLGARISEPLGSQTADVIEWSRTLRSRSPSPTRQNMRSRSPSPSRGTTERGNYLTDVQRSMPDFSMKKSKSTNKMRKSTGSLAANLGTSTSKSKAPNLAGLDNIEAEYIKNLQQQIYFLELESNYLRDQAKKATEMHPKMTAEAERMLTKLRQMQLEIDSLQLEVKKKDTMLAVSSTEKEKTFERLHDEEAARQRDKRNLMDEIIQLKKEKDMMERELSQKDTQLFDAKTELDKSATALKSAEIKIQSLRSQDAALNNDECEINKLELSTSNRGRQLRSDILHSERDAERRSRSYDISHRSRSYDIFHKREYYDDSYDSRSYQYNKFVDNDDETIKKDVYTHDDKQEKYDLLFDEGNRKYCRKNVSDMEFSEGEYFKQEAPLEQRGEQHNLTQITLDEKRSELLSVQTQLRELEDKYYNNTLQIQDKVTNDMKIISSNEEEIRLLRQKLKETEMAAEHDRYMKSKLGEDNANLVRENALLQEQLADTQRNFDRERSARESTESRHTMSHGELLQLRDKEKDARFEINHLQEQLRKEQEKSRHYLENLTKTESATTTQDLELKTLKSRINELESFQGTLEKECEQLRKDKLLLVDHVSEIQRKLESRDHEIVSLKSEMQLMEGRMRESQRMNIMESSLQSQKWEEFEKLAESMRSLSHTMSTTGTSKSRVQQY